MVGGQLKLKAGQSLNFETEPSVTLTVTVTDAGGLSTSQAFTIAVSNVSEAPIVVNPITTLFADEDATATVIDLSAVFDDVDIASSGDSLSLSALSSSPALVSVSISGTTLTLSYGANQNGVAIITLTAVDSGGLQVNITFTVIVTPIGDTPQVASVSTFPNTRLILS